MRVLVLILGVALSVGVFCLPASADVEVLAKPVDVEAAFPKDLDYNLDLDADWSRVRELRVSVTLPEDCPQGTTVVCYLKDAQWNWYQYEPTGTLRSGKTTQIRIDMSPGAERWLPRGHNRQWDNLAAQKVRGFGLKLFNAKTWKGKVRIERIYGRTGDRPEEPLAVADLRANADKVPCFAKYELSFDLTRTYDNPFDPDTIDVRAKFTAPSGKTYEQFGFLYREYVRRQSPLGAERLTPVGKSCWKVRFTPNEPGTWKVEMTLWDKDLQKEAGATPAKSGAAKTGTGSVKREDACVRVKPIFFTCTPSKSHGFVTIDRKKDPFYFSYQDGTFFYPIGQMLRSPVDLRRPYESWEGKLREGEGTYAYDRIMGRLSASGVNFIRLWMGMWWVGLEAPRDYAPGYAGLGQYNMLNAWRLDYVLEEAERLGIYVKINLNNHGQLQRNVDQEFYESPYNVMLGGMLRTPDEFWTNAEAKKYVKRRYRYIVARWAYSPNVLAWEMFNEVDLTEDFDSSTVADWHREFGRYLKRIDPWKHLITTHFYKEEQASQVYSLPEIEFTPGDLYEANVVTAMRNRWLEKKGYDKPAMISEFGVGHTRDQVEANFHGGLWSSTVVPMAGTAMFWYWNFIDIEDLYFHYKPVALFNAGEDRRGKDWQLTAAQVRRDGTLHSDLRVLGRQCPTEAHLWVYDSPIFSQNDGDRYRNPPVFGGATLTVPNLESGKYHVEFWNTYDGKITGTLDLAADGDTLKIPLPTVKADMAVKIKKAP